MSENKDDGFGDHSSLAAERQKAIIVIELLGQLFRRCCNACPMFVMGSIKDALHSAFGSKLARERRPLLIYIHHNRSPSIDKFCLNMFCSEILIEFLNENYIVWPWDITEESNRNILIKIWEKTFPKESHVNFSMDQCPMLIGIMRQSRDDDAALELSYECKVLLIGDGLVRTVERLTLETLLNQLLAFKEECDENEQNLPYNFGGQMRFPTEIVLEIAEYLSLNDAVMAFSIAILPLLWKHNRKLPVVQPSEKFMRTVIQKIKPERIISLQIEADHFGPTMELASRDIFKHIRSLTIKNLSKKIGDYEIKRYFPNPTHFSLRYEEDMAFHSVSDIVDLMPDSIKQFEIHCGSILCSHSRLDLLFNRIFHSTMNVHTFVLNVDHTFSSLINQCVQNYNYCLLRTITDFIRIMSLNIQHVCVIINKGNVETFLDKDEWMELVKICKKLKKITLKVIKNTSQSKELQEKIQEIENGLHIIRKSIQFEVKIK